MTPQQIMFPWGQYKTSEIARVLGVSRGRVITALRHLGLVGKNVRGKGIPADQTEAVRCELDRVANAVRERSVSAKTKREAKQARKAA